MPANNKNRKSEAQERFEEADNAGRFAGDDEDSRQAKDAGLKAGAIDTTGYNSGKIQNSNRDGSEARDEPTDADARRHPTKTEDTKGEAQNINDDTGRTLDDDELAHARQKANESKGVEDSR